MSDSNGVGLRTNLLDTSHPNCISDNVVCMYVILLGLMETTTELMTQMTLYTNFIENCSFLLFFLENL